MNYSVKVPQGEIDDVMNWAAENVDNGTRNYPGMTYEEGVDAALRWLFGLSTDRPDAE